MGSTTISQAVAHQRVTSYAELERQSALERAKAGKALSALVAVDAEYLTVEQLQGIVSEVARIARDMSADSELKDRCLAAVYDLDQAFVSLEG